MIKPARNLERVYATNNRKFFDGQLPSDTRIWWSDEIGEKFSGLTILVQNEAEKDEPSHRYFHIYVDPMLDDARHVRLTLLHEMCHVKLAPYMGHGRRFQEEMKRLALRDAFKEWW